MFTQGHRPSSLAVVSPYFLTWDRGTATFILQLWSIWEFEGGFPNQKRTRKTGQ